MKKLTMSEMSRIYFELQEQAEYYGMDLDFETLEFIPKRELKPIPKWQQDYKDKMREADNDPASPEQAWA